MSSLRAKNETVYDEILNLLSNVLFPVVVFLIWAVFTTVGTVIVQNLPEQRYYEMYPLPVANVIIRLHLTHVFHSVPYISLVVLLLVSLGVCTFRRVIPKRFPKDRAVPIRNFGLHDEYQAALDSEQASAAVRQYLKSRGFALREQVIDGVRWLFGDKQKWARYGVLVAHLGFVVITFGVFLGWLRGFSGQFMIYKGQTVSVAPANLLLTLNSFTATFIPVQTTSGVSYQASKFQSDVNISGAAGNVNNASILVNHPLVAPGDVYFYQASYGFGGNLRVTRNGKSVKLAGTDGHLQPQDAIFLPGTSRVIEYGTLLGPTDPSQTPPGVALPKSDEYALCIFHDNIPTTNKPLLLAIGASADVGDGYRVTAFPPTPSSGLTYRYDPGQGWVGLGCIILVSGFIMALFFVPVKLYVRLVPGGDETGVEVAATTTKGNAIYEDEFKALIAGLRSALPQRGPAATDDDRVKAYA